MNPLDSLNVYQRYFVEEFADDYKERRLPRREMLRKVLYVTGSVPLTASVLLALGCGDSSNDKASAGVSTAAPTAAAGRHAAAGRGDGAARHASRRHRRRGHRPADGPGHRRARRQL